MAHRQALASAMILALACAAPAFAKGTMTPSFVTKAAQGGMAEVTLSQIAADKATDPQVRDFAQKMVTDHQKANDELKALAQQKGWKLPDSTDASHRATARRLEKATGQSFDHEYMEAMVADHNKTVAMFRSYEKTGKDADLKAWVVKELPGIEQHDKMAKEQHSSMPGNGKMKMKHTKTTKTTTSSSSSGY